MLENKYNENWSILDDTTLEMNSSNKLFNERENNVKTSIRY